MKPLYKALTVALLHLLIVSSLGFKLLYDRATRPRAWVKTVPFDPNLPIRGRYVRLGVQVETRGIGENDSNSGWVTLSVEDGRMIATPSEQRTGHRVRFRPARAPRGPRDPVNRFGFLRMRAVGGPFAEHLGIKGGLQVEELRPSGPADRAGIEVGDIVAQVGGTAVTSWAQLGNALQAQATGPMITLSIVRGHSQHEIEVPVELSALAPPAETIATLQTALAFFIPEHIEDPSIRPAGEELWVEVTLPRKGPPRPIRLGIRKDGGEITPLPLN